MLFIETNKFLRMQDKLTFRIYIYDIFYFFQFLNAMAKKDLIQVKEFPKGIENITAINWAHEDIKSFVVDLVSVWVCRNAAPRPRYLLYSSCHDFFFFLEAAP